MSKEGEFVTKIEFESEGFKTTEKKAELEGLELERFSGSWGAGPSGIGAPHPARIEYVGLWVRKKVPKNPK